MRGEDFCIIYQIKVAFIFFFLRCDGFIANVVVNFKYIFLVVLANFLLTWNQFRTNYKDTFLWDSSVGLLKMKRSQIHILMIFFLALAMCVVLPSCQKSPSCQIKNAGAPAVCNVHDTISFGHYDGDPIRWIILDKNDNGQYLVISEKSLDVQPFSTYWHSWDESTIRSWLNGYDRSYNKAGNDYTSDNFINTAFSAEERARILSTEIPAEIFRPAEAHYGALPHHLHRVEKSKATTDKIFLLSHREAKHYFTSDESRKADPTSYAKKQAKHFVVTELGLSYWLFKNELLEYKWWLRSPEGAVVSTDGKLYDYHNMIYTVSIEGPHGIRPAMWVQF